MTATHYHQVEIAKLLVDVEADVNKQDNIQGKTEILAYILENSTLNQEIYNPIWRRCCYPAAEKGHLETVKLLIEDGKVEINHQNNSGYTALIEAVALRDGSKVYQDIAAELLKVGVNKSLRDYSGRTAEDYAKQSA
ncbi:ankyrin repeat domain-containing protein [Melissococcus sp. OM08-11BH]|uniref:ankyrin repeat domain-containing protein n=1 Tax=Melissococcus sp. OM08-11BH TaxID=2293110 RepID=UPI000E517D43|nr:ankyrin repeat domain-containing protein [Melissococcus sp. OM08-11BH]